MNTFSMKDHTMITVQCADRSFWDMDVDGYLFFVSEDMNASSDLAVLEKEAYPYLRSMLKKHAFEGKKGQSFVLTGMRDDRLVQYLFVGIGKGSDSWNDELEYARRALAAMVQLMKKHEIQRAAVELPPAKVFNISPAELALDFSATAHRAAYEFTTFKTQERQKKYEGVLFFAVGGGEANELELACQRGEIIGKATNAARHFSDLPANIMNPTKLSEEAQAIANSYGLVCTILNRQDAEKLGMGGFLAVDAGSDQDGKFIILEYKAPQKDAQTIAFVGKGVTFDTGGVSLKPANYMSDMKYDMAGAAAVIGAMQAIGQLKPNINVVGITPSVENMPSGKSSRQDDIVTFMNGKTAEIKNTDAEGRLILADGLCYAEKFYSPDVIIDIATLTGACIMALGHFYAAAMTQNDALFHTLDEIGRATGDRLWRLPFHDDYKPANKSRVADVANVGSALYGGQAITAGLFLANFVEKTPWVHLDVAGTAFAVPGINYLGKGATGAGVRLLVDFVLKYQKGA